MKSEMQILHFYLVGQNPPGCETLGSIRCHTNHPGGSEDLVCCQWHIHNDHKEEYAIESQFYKISAMITNSVIHR